MWTVDTAHGDKRSFADIATLPLAPLLKPINSASASVCRGSGPWVDTNNNISVVPGPQLDTSLPPVQHTAPGDPHTDRKCDHVLTAARDTSPGSVTDHVTTAAAATITTILL